MPRDDFSDYEELLKMFEDDSSDKKTESKSSSSKSFEENFAEDVARSQSNRKKRLDDFDLDISSDSSNEKNAYKNGVYFSNPPRNIENEARREKSGNTKKKEPKVDKFNVTTPPATEKQKKVIAKKEAKNKKREGSFFGRMLSSENLSKNVLTIAVIALVSVILCIYGAGCINDVLAINNDEKTVEVSVSQGMSDGEVIDILGDKDLIHNELFCKLFMKFFGKSGDYVSGSYTLSSDMGIENMISTMKADITLSETVTLTFPEGYTIDQIAEKLEANDVCTASSFISTLQSVDFSEEYDFIAAIPNKESRFRLLEGYMYPDTYEFYLGENPSSVARKFLENFKNKWTDEYQEKADELGISLDEIITIASILQKEAATADQMDDISSVIYNRLNKSSTYPWLQCDSTETYLLETIKPTLTSSTEDTQKYISYRDNYDTYSTECTGLPIGAISNPGDSAIKAALNPADTDYYYFRHDKKGGVYYAATFAEHQANESKVAAVDDEE